MQNINYNLIHQHHNIPDAISDIYYQISTVFYNSLYRRARDLQCSQLCVLLSVN